MYFKAKGYIVLLIFELVSQITSLTTHVWASSQCLGTTNLRDIWGLVTYSPQTVIVIRCPVWSTSRQEKMYKASTTLNITNRVKV